MHHHNDGRLAPDGSAPLTDPFGTIIMGVVAGAGRLATGRPAQGHVRPDVSTETSGVFCCAEDRPGKG